MKTLLLTLPLAATLLFSQSTFAQSKDDDYLKLMDDVRTHLKENNPEKAFNLLENSPKTDIAPSVDEKIPLLIFTYLEREDMEGATRIMNNAMSKGFSFKNLIVDPLYPKYFQTINSQDFLFRIKNVY